MADGKITSAHVYETGESAFAVNIEVSAHMIKGDEPESSGGLDFGPAPYDLLLASLGECSSMTVRWFAQQQRWPLNNVEVKLTHHKEGRVDIFSKFVTLHGDELTQEQRAKLIEVAGKCPVQRTLEGAPVITTQAA